MSVTLLGPDALDALLDTDPRVTVSNRARAPSPVTILAAVVALHDEDGEVRFKTAYRLNLGPGAARALDPFPPTPKALLAAEIVLRVLAGENPQVVEVYAKVGADPADSLGDVEFGVTNAGDPDEPNATLIADAPEFAVYTRTMN
ncbi:hypothetical protein [Rhodospirillaceae bacterium SYSU D60014]|uniref:hypothetical protein n=1 Tax=Virgifigura deserti TaxID=2268457 RepID=UPI000E6701D5